MNTDFFKAHFKFDANALCDIVESQKKEFLLLENLIMDTLKNMPFLVQRLPRNFEQFLKKISTHFTLNLGILTEKEIIAKLNNLLDIKITSLNNLQTRYNDLER
jgi:hypothetical protein